MAERAPESPMLNYADPKYDRPWDRGARGFWRWVRVTTVSCIAGVGLMFVVASINGFVLGPVGAAMGVVLVLVVLMTLATSLRRARRARAARVCSYLEQAVRANLPLPQMLMFSASAERGTMRRRLRDLSQRLESGSSLTASLDLAVPELPERAISKISAAETTGTLPRPLNEVVCEDLTYAPERSTRAQVLMLYVLLVSTALFAVVLLLNVFVAPKLAQILRDFRAHGQVAPIGGSLGFASQIIAPIAAVASIITILAFTARGAREIFQTSPIPRPFRTPLARLEWHLPVFGGIVRDRGLADVCALVADGLHTGRPLTWLITQAAQPHLNDVLRGKLLRWLDGWNSGERLSVAARNAGLPSLMVNMLGEVHDSSHAADTFDFLARYYKTRGQRSAEFIQSLAIPLVAILGGTFVLYVALSIFVPIVKIIDLVMPYKVGL